MHSNIEKINSLNYSLFRFKYNILINLGHLDVFLDSDIWILIKQTPHEYSNKFVEVIIEEEDGNIDKMKVEIRLQIITKPEKGRNEEVWKIALTHHSQSSSLSFTLMSSSLSLRRLQNFSLRRRLQSFSLTSSSK